MNRKQAFSVRLESDMKDWVEEEAAKRDISTAAFIRDVLIMERDWRERAKRALAEKKKREDA